MSKPDHTAPSAGTADAVPARRVGPDFETEFPGADRTSTECYINVCHTAERLFGLLERHARAEFTLSNAALMVLCIIEGSPEPITPTIIAERAIITTASITSLLDTLERRSLVNRTPHPTDRRKLVVELTDEGRAIVERFLPAARSIESAVMTALTAAERATLLGLLAKVQSGIDPVESGARPLPTVTRARRGQLPG